MVPLFDSLFSSNTNGDGLSKEHRAEAIYNQIKNSLFLNFADINSPSLKWNIKVFCLNINRKEDREVYEEIVSKAMNEDMNESRGVVILGEEGKFLETGEYKIFLKIGEWEYVKPQSTERNPKNN